MNENLPPSSFAPEQYIKANTNTIVVSGISNDFVFPLFSNGKWKNAMLNQKYKRGAGDRVAVLRWIFSGLLIGCFLLPCFIFVLKRQQAK
jgi:hypothetical protein